MSPLTARQLGQDPEIGEFLYTPNAVISGATATQIRCFTFVNCSRIIVTEVGVQAHVFTGTGHEVNLRVAKKSALTTDMDTFSGPSITSLFSSPSSANLTATGVAYYRNPKGIYEVTESDMNTLSDGRNAINLGVVCFEVGTWTNLSGRCWMKAIPVYKR